jgi:hypothetical protein
MIKNGQMCISVDYVLAPVGRVREVVELARQYVPGADTGLLPQR